MTPEDRMQAVAELSTTSFRTRDSITKHGAAAIRSAVAEAQRVQKSRIVAWLRHLAEQARRGELESDAGVIDTLVFCLTDAGEPETWAARTGWTPPGESE